jgi:hypothetical protein
MDPDDGLNRDKECNATLSRLGGGERGFVQIETDSRQEGGAMPTEEDRLKKFMEVVEKIPPTWTCFVCEREFPNHPGGEVPYAMATDWNHDSNSEVVVGEICKSCHEK